MKIKIDSYLKEIIEKSNNKTNKKFGFSDIDRINIFLIKQVLEKRQSLWIENSRDLDKFYEAVIFAASVYFFEENYREDKRTQPEIDDKYKNKKGKTFKVLNVKYDDNRKCNIIKLQGISKGNSVIVSLNLGDLDSSFTKLSDKATKNTRESIKPMLDFLLKSLDITEQIPSFPRKFAIVAQKNDFENCFKVLDKKIFPYVYIADSGHETPNLLLADCMFYVASDYETIKNHIFDKGIKVEIIIFIGNKYNHQIQQDIDREYFEQAIFIGEQKPDAGCLKWQWTLPEYQYFDDLPEGKIKTIEVKNEILGELIDKFIKNIHQLEQEHYVKLQARMLPYISYVYPLVVLAQDSRLKNRLGDLQHSFNKKSKQILGEEFIQVDIDWVDFHQQLVDDYQSILEQVDFENNAKTHELQQATETDYLLVPERQTIEVWKNEIKKLNWQKAKVISFSGLEKAEKKGIVTVLSLPDYDFYCSIRNSRHTVNWLLYDKEYQRYQDFVTKYDNELIQEYKSKDRKKLTGIDYPDDIKTESLDDLIDRIRSNKTDNNGYNTSYEDHIDKEIIFTDNCKKELSANSIIILIDKQNKPRKYKVSDLSVGDKIRVYENQHKEVLFDGVSKNAENDNFNEILNHSQLWKRKLKAHCANNKEIATLCNIKPSTVEGWLKPNSKTKFPQNINSLKYILGDDYHKIYKSNKDYNNIMIALGRDLSDEVSDYIISKQKGKLLSKFDDISIKEISEHNMPIKTIKKIEIIEKAE